MNIHLKKKPFVEDAYEEVSRTFRNGLASLQDCRSHRLAAISPEDRFHQSHRLIVEVITSSNRFIRSSSLLMIRYAMLPTRSHTKGFVE